ncbi:hypothetical protein SAMN05428976_10677 [Clostridium sp. USBA 49]|uniref:DUF6762 family protein n=1 Tax=Clostridium sp. USBA 49 TaxID=1881060 RepID=UPI00099AF578|nr:DUF6762 family protein [Clostridium sp. USBA 49]SKA83895.1 hypothetical protein SAMN05428976_10677 [Clostridium sp. USBA 49]
MDFSSLVLMEKDIKTNQFIKEMGSFAVNEGAEYITKFYYDGEKVNIFFDTNRDVEEWEFYAIYDLFDGSAFEENGFILEEVDDEYNPTWVLKFDYIEEHNKMEEKIQLACEIIEEEMNKVFENIKNKEEEYKE